MILGTYPNLDERTMFLWLLANCAGGTPYTSVCICGTTRGVPYPYPPKYNIMSDGLVVGPLF